MPTPQKRVEFNRDLVIERATELFWREGYDGVSIGNLVDATGLNRYALYQAFGGKRDIFIAVLDAYLERAKASISAALAVPGISPYDALYNCIFEKMLRPEMFPAGCLMCTTCVDVASGDPEIAERVGQCTEELNVLFAHAFRDAQAEGRAPGVRDPSAFAELASALYFSTGVQARMGRSRDDLVSALRKTLDSLKH
ncbi:MAG: TetR/AcrR family transcriptional regulator [Pseudomonadota bacterium]